MKILPLVFILLSVTASLHAQECTFGAIFMEQSSIDSFAQNYPGCKILNADITISEAVDNLQGLAQLEGINGSLEISCKVRNLDGLQNLKYVTGTLNIKENRELEDLSALANLTTVGFLQIGSNNKITTLNGFNQLKEINHTLSIDNNTELQSLEGLHNLERIGIGSGISGVLSITRNPKIKSLVPLSNLSGLQNGMLVLIALDALESLKGIDQLTDLSFIRLEQIPLLSNLEDLSNIQLVNGSLWLLDLEGLRDLRGLKNLTTLRGVLRLQGLNRLADLSGLEQLTTVKGLLRIENNASLRTLYGIHNINPTILSAGSGRHLQIIDNPMLARCDIENICTLLHLPNSEVLISSNKEGCNNPTEIRCIDNGLGGKVFIDYNQNGIQDTLEAPLANIAVGVEPLGLTVLTDETGKYYFSAVEHTEYMISLPDQEDWRITSDSSSYTTTFISGLASNDQYNFGLYPLIERHEGSLNISSYATRCNEQTRFVLKYQNTGNFIENGKVVLHLDTLTRFVKASVPANVQHQESGILEWQFDSLYPHEFREIILDLSMPDETHTGKQMDFRGVLIYDGTNENLETIYSPPVLCSFDPNDIIVSPPGFEDEHFTPLGTPLQYTIRFQNTGNAPAVNIRILDTLDKDLSMRTFRVLNSSFPVSTYLRGNALEFKFTNILLPDSTSNEPASHGFITYSIEPNPDMEHRTLVKNTAYILFDFNPPVVTNTAYNTFVEEAVTLIPKDAPVPAISIFPNPADGQLFVIADGEEVESIRILDMLGKKILETNAVPIDISGMKSGVYVVAVQLSGQRTASQKLVIAHP